MNSDSQTLLEFWCKINNKTRSLCLFSALETATTPPVPRRLAAGIINIASWQVKILLSNDDFIDYWIEDVGPLMCLPRRIIIRETRSMSYDYFYQEQYKFVFYIEVPELTPVTRAVGLIDSGTQSKRAARVLGNVARFNSHSNLKAERF